MILVRLGLGLCHSEPGADLGGAGGPGVRPPLFEPKFEFFLCKYFFRIFEQWPPFFQNPVSAPALHSRSMFMQVYHSSFTAMPLTYLFSSVRDNCHDIN